MPRRPQEEADYRDRPPRKASPVLWIVLVVVAVGFGAVVLVGVLGVVMWRRPGLAVAPPVAAAALTTAAVIPVPAAKVVADEEPVYRGTMAKFFYAFQDNPIKAEADYMRKVVEIKGMGMINNEDRGYHMYFSMDVWRPRENRSIVAYLAKGEEAKFAALKPDPTIVTGVTSATIKGRVARWRPDAPGS